jgi:hypothetical protein
LGTLTDADQDLKKTQKWEAALDVQRGAAGIHQPSTIKCLHTHLANYLSYNRGSKDNIIGEWAMEFITKLLQEKKQDKNLVADDSK